MSSSSELPVIQLAEGISGRVRPGTGEGVLWLHGYTVDGSMWGDMWDRLPGWQHIAIDLPGHGASDSIERMIDLPTLGRRLGQMCISRGVRHIVALSFGTLTATQIAIEFPSHFSSIVLSAPSLAGGPRELEVARVHGTLVQYYLQFGPGPWMRDIWMKCRIWAGTERVPEMRQYMGSLIDKHDWSHLKQMAIQRYTQSKQTEEALQKIEASVLVMIGDRELPSFRTVAATLKRNIPRCDVLELADADHLAMIQYPEVSAPAIEAHLKANQSASLTRDGDSPSQKEDKQQAGNKAGNNP
ncbi:MAG TPA: alpha/beta hydrolase [Terriglobia bacterium]|jgi:2-succinyl-6-hydroxy-2,4-cyclohexadiene-1-carboxylate synthase